MPTDEASRTVDIDAHLPDVLATIRDVEGEVRWVPEVLEAEVLEEDADHLPTKAHVRASAPVGSDEYVLRYEHGDDSMAWHLVSGRLQTAQDAEYRLRPTDAGHTLVTFTLRISHHLPLPGFLRRRAIDALVAHNVEGLKDYLEQRSAPS